MDIRLLSTAVAGAFVLWLIWRWFSGKSADDTARVDTKDT